VDQLVFKIDWQHPKMFIRTLSVMLDECSMRNRKLVSWVNDGAFTEQGTFAGLIDDHFFQPLGILSKCFSPRRGLQCIGVPGDVRDYDKAFAHNLSQ